MTWNPHSAISDRYTADDRTRPVQAAHHDVSLAIARAERYFSGLGHAKEADQLRALGSLVQANAVQHCERLLANGHHKDSQAEADSHSNPPVSGTDCGNVAIRETLGIATSDISGDVAAAPVSEVNEIPLDIRIQRHIAEWSARAREEQAYEVAVKFVYRARAMLESGSDHQGRLLSSDVRKTKALQLIESAKNALESKAEMAEVENG